MIIVIFDLQHTAVGGAFSVPSERRRHSTFCSHQVTLFSSIFNVYCCRLFWGANRDKAAALRLALSSDVGNLRHSLIVGVKVSRHLTELGAFRFGSGQFTGVHGFVPESLSGAANGLF